MRRLVLLGSSCLVVACGPIEVDSPFENPISDGTVTPPAESSEGEPGSTSTDGSTGDATDPDSSGGAPVCGNGVREGEELCDVEDFGDLTCVTEGFGAGTLVCGASCQTYATDGCYTCGDAVIQAAEDCEGPLDPSVTCEAAGFTEGALACDMVTCLYDTSGCSLCGNGIVEGTEPCDGDDVGGMTCADMGFTDGTLACQAGACMLDLSGCTGGNYVQDFEGGSIPSEFDGSGTAVWGVDSGNPIAGSFSAASGLISHSQTSNLSLAVNYAVAGTVAFMHEESTEGSFDYLEFYVDGVLQQEWSGTNAAQLASYPVAAGNHTLEWRYTKDGSVNSGSDRVWIDDLVLTGGVPTG
jgi:hypothetical protein